MEHSSLNSMKKEPLRWCSDRTGHEPFIRKGSTGGWDELLSEEQAGLLQKRLNEMFSKEELEFLGEQYQWKSTGTIKVFAQNIVNAIVYFIYILYGNMSAIMHGIMLPQIWSHSYFSFFSGWFRGGEFALVLLIVFQLFKFCSEINLKSSSVVHP